VLGITFSEGMRPVLTTGFIATIVTGAIGTLVAYWMPPESWRTLLINVTIVVLANIVPALLIVEKKDLDKLRSLLKRKTG
jgi:hypothetical protein